MNHAAPFRFRLAKKLEQHIRANMEVSKVGANFNYCYEGTISALDYYPSLTEAEEYEVAVENFWENNWDEFLAKEQKLGKTNENASK
tara:strand:+ start:2277 stop:2537 length:261 start_codon:yes stop_codon:yes gene_type:complete